MNGRQAKQLRRNARKANYEWYLGLLTDEQQTELTPELAVEMTPAVDYWHEKHEMKDKEGNRYISVQRFVSQFTRRWFIKQEKKNYGMLHTSTVS